VKHRQHRFGPVLDCWIRIRGMTILYSEFLQRPEFIERKADAKHLVLDNGHYNPSPEKLPASLTLLLLQLTLGGSTPAVSRWDAILLVPIGVSKDEFQRVGYYKVAENSDGLPLDFIDVRPHSRNPSRPEVYTDKYFTGWEDKELKIV
jgi:hypothetical protein